MHFKKIIAIVLTFSFLFPVNVLANLDVNAKSSILIEPISGKVLLENNSHEKLPIASITKVMTILLIYEAIDSGKIKWDDVVTTSDHAASMGGSQIWLEPNEKQTVSELTKSIVIASANDSAVAMAEFISGSEDEFVKLMNEKAKELQMNNTNFKNACGLDEDDHYSSAFDVALMSKELIIKHPKVIDYTTVWQDYIIHRTNKGEQEFGLTNTNKLIRSYEGATGLKTGSTSKALYCLSASAYRDDMNLIAVLLGAPDPTTRFDETKKMLNYGFSNFSVCNALDTGEIIGKVEVYKGESDFVDVSVKEKIAVVVEKDLNIELESIVDLVDGLAAPVKAGTKAGEVIYMFDGTEVGRTDLVCVNDVETAKLSTIMNKVLKSWIDFK